MKAVIVGGGLAGLVAANELARGGADVTLLERSPVLGGRAVSDAVADTRLNRGPHALYRSGAAMKILGELGVKARGVVPDLHRFDVVIDGEIARAPTTAWSTARAAYMSAADKMQLAVFLGALFRLDPRDWEDRPFADLVERYADSSVAQRVLSMTATISTFGRSPRLSAATALRQVKASLSNVLYLEGGWQSLVDQLAVRATERGVRIETSHPVRALDELDADVVVLAVAPGVVEDLTGAAFGERRPTKQATLDLVMGTTPAERRNTFDLDRGVFLSFHPGNVVHCAKYLDPFDEADPAATRAEIEAILDLAQSGWRDHVAHERYLPAMHVNEWFPDAQTSGQAGRPPVQLDERTFIAGDWVGAEGLLADAACASGQAAALLALDAHHRHAA